MEHIIELLGIICDMCEEGIKEGKPENYYLLRLMAIKCNVGYVIQQIKDDQRKGN